MIKKSSKRRFRRWLQPGIGLKRWLLLFGLGVMLSAFGLAFALNYRFIGVLEENIFRFLYYITGSFVYTATTLLGIVAIVIGIVAMIWATQRIIRAVVLALEPDGAGALWDTIYESRKLGSGPEVVAIGGGTGLSVLLRGIKGYTSNITAIVTVADDGGSSGRLREEMGIVPPGDLRNCLVALADTEPVMESLFQYRFDEKDGTLAGHNFGNLFIAAMIEMTGGNIEEALLQANKVLRVRGQVIPSTHSLVKLRALFKDGTTLVGESEIGHSHNPIDRMFLEPAEVTAPENAIEAIRKAKVIILGPGSLYTSVIPNLLVPGIVEALKESSAPKIYVCNVMTQPGETDHYTALDHLNAIEKHGGPGLVDVMVVNNSLPSHEVLAKYKAEGAEPVLIEREIVEQMGIRVIATNLISHEDLVRHDPERLSKVIRRLVFNLKGYGRRR